LGQSPHCGQAGFGVVDLGLTRVGVLPEVKELLVVLAGAGLVFLRLGDLPQPIETLGHKRHVAYCG
jgi:hypothetical protein